MVCMCGSNLEGEYGSASADFRKMPDAGISTSDVSVLIMTGRSGSPWCGSKTWRNRSASLIP